jgi:hypothetical protein
MGFYFNKTFVQTSDNTLNFVNKNGNKDKIDAIWLKENDDDYLANIIDLTVTSGDNGGIAIASKAIIPFSKIEYIIPWQPTPTPVPVQRYVTDKIAIYNKNNKIIYPIRPLFVYLKFAYLSESPTTGVTDYTFRLQVVRVEGKLKHNLDIYINDSLFYTLPAETFSYAVNDPSNNEQTLKDYTVTNAMAIKIYCKVNGVTFSEVSYGFRAPPALIQL